MSAVFADTAFYVALVNRDDSLHSEAATWAANNSNPVITTEFVLLEVANFFKRPGNDRQMFAAFVTAIQADPATTILPVDPRHFQAGLALFANRPDKEWSLTDCISFVVMNERELRQALTADRHFEQAGFLALLLV
jgi:predicted nucleic acid-binding protein